MRKILKHKPLIEAIFELRWELQKQSSPGERIDPYYRIFTGVMYEEARKEYPFHELLPAADIPENLVPYIIQQRFRKAEGEWPLIQIGPGIVTLNDTSGYVWEDFSERVLHLVDLLLKSYPNSKQLDFNVAMLRYIDAYRFDYEKNDTLEFLREKMKTKISLHPDLFKDTEINSSPLMLDLSFEFNCSNPIGTMKIRLSHGKKEGENAFTWQTMFRSIGEITPKNKEAIKQWVESAHKLTDDWFFKLIDGDLLKEFE